MNALNLNLEELRFLFREDKRSLFIGIWVILSGVAGFVILTDIVYSIVGSIDTVASTCGEMWKNIGQFMATLQSCGIMASWRNYSWLDSKVIKICG